MLNHANSLIEWCNCQGVWQLGNAEGQIGACSFLALSLLCLCLKSGQFHYLSNWKDLCSRKMWAVLAEVGMEPIHLKGISKGSTKPHRVFVLFWHLSFMITLLGLQTETWLYNGMFMYYKCCKAFRGLIWKIVVLVLSCLSVAVQNCCFICQICSKPNDFPKSGYLCTGKK